MSYEILVNLIKNNDTQGIKNLYLYNVLDLHFDNYILFDHGCKTCNLELVKFVLNESTLRDEPIPDKIKEQCILNLTRQIPISLVNVSVVDGYPFLFDVIPLYASSYCTLLFKSIIYDCVSLVDILLYKVMSLRIKIIDKNLSEVLKQIYPKFMKLIAENKKSSNESGSLVITKVITCFQSIVNINVYMELMFLALMHSNECLVRLLLNSEHTEKFFDLKYYSPGNDYLLWVVVFSGLVDLANIIISKIDPAKYDLDTLIQKPESPLMFNKIHPEKSLLILINANNAGIKINFRLRGDLLFRKFASNPRFISLLLSLSTGYTNRTLKRITAPKKTLNECIIFWVHYFKNRNMLYNRYVAEFNIKFLK